MPVPNTRLLLVHSDNLLWTPIIAELQENDPPASILEIGAAGSGIIVRNGHSQGEFAVVVIDDSIIRISPSETERVLSEILHLLSGLSIQNPHLEAVWVVDPDLLPTIERRCSVAYSCLSKPTGAEQVVSTIQAAVLRERVRKLEVQRSSTQHLLQSTAALWNSCTQKEVLQAVLNGVRSLGFDRARLYLLTKDGKFIECRGQVGSSKRRGKLRFPVRGDAYIEKVLETRSPSVFRRGLGEQFPYEEELEKEGVDEWAFVPLSREGTVIGLLAVDNKVTHQTIVDAQIDSLIMLAEQAVAALEKARLFRRQARVARTAREHERALNSLQKVCARIVRMSDASKITRAISREAVRLFEVDHSGVVLFDDEKHITATVRDEYPSDFGTKGTRLPVRGVPAEEHLLDINRLMPIVIPDVDEDWVKKELGPVKAILKRFDIQSIMVVPLVYRDQVLGSFSLDTVGRKRTWNHYEISLCLTFATQVAAALANATSRESMLRLHSELEQQRQLLEKLDEASRNLRTPRGATAIQEEIVRQAAKLLGGEFAHLYLYRPELEKMQLGQSYPPNSYQNLASAHKEMLVAQATIVVQHGHAKLLRHHSQLPSYVAVPLKTIRQHIGALLVSRPVGRSSFEESDCEILKRFAETAAIMLEISTSVSREQRLGAEVTTFRDLVGFIHTLTDRGKMYRAILTGVTAEYGFGFNRAALFMVRDDTLIGVAAVGRVNRQDQVEDWGLSETQGFNGFEAFKAQMEGAGFPDTPLQEAIARLVLSPNDRRDPFYRIMNGHDKYIHISEANQHELQALPAAFTIAFRPDSPLVIVPIIGRGNVRGVLVADNKFTSKAVSDDDLESLIKFLRQAAIRISTNELLQEQEQFNDQLQALYAASNKLVLQPAESLVRSIVNDARQAADAQGATLILIDEANQVRDLINVGADHPISNSSSIRPGGISIQVMRDRPYDYVEDVEQERQRVNDLTLERGIKAALCVRVVVAGKPIGVFWAHYDKPRKFLKSEIEAVQHYVNQAAITVESARRMREITELGKAVEALVGVADVRETLNQIVTGARNVLNADFALLIPTDGAGEMLQVADAVIAGVHKEVWEGLKSHSVPGEYLLPPAPDGLPRSRREPSIGTLPRDLDKPLQGAFRDMGAISGLRLELNVGGSTLGVLFVVYQRQRGFSQEERTTAALFAKTVALALRKARDHERIRQMDEASRVVTKLTVLEDLTATLKSIAARTKKIVGCNAVVIYAYDHEMDLFNTAPEMDGVLDEEAVKAVIPAVPGATPYRVLELADELYESKPHAAKDPIFGGDFQKREGIVSAIGVKLMAGSQPVGVMFVNYRRMHRLTDDERRSIRLLARYAAVAIRGAQLHEDEVKSRTLRSALSYVGHKLTRALSKQEILDVVVQAAWHLAPPGATLSHVALVEDDRLLFKATYPSESLQPLLNGINYLDLHEKGEHSGITTRAVRTAQTQLVGDVTNDESYVTLDEATCSELATPILVKGGAIGVINVEHSRRFAFGPKEKAAIEQLAAYAAISIENATRYEELEQAKRQIAAKTAVALMGTLNAIWGHEITTNGQLVFEAAEDALKKLGSHPHHDKVKQALSRIQDLGDKIRGTPAAPPMPGDYGFTPVPIVPWLHTRLMNLWKDPNSRYRRAAEYEFKSELDESTLAQIDSTMLRQIITILLDNALNAMKNSPRRLVTFHCFADKKYIYITVTDTGCGISNDILEKVYQDHIKPRVQNFDSGKGMGLLLTATILDAYEGGIKVDKTGPEGTTMRIQIPKANP